MVGLPQWLLACKAFLQEGFNELRLKSTTSIGGRDWLVSWSGDWWDQGVVERSDRTLLNPVVGNKITLPNEELVIDGANNLAIKLSEVDEALVDLLVINAHTLKGVQILRMKTGFMSAVLDLCTQMGARIESISLRPIDKFPLTIDVLELEVDVMNVRPNSAWFQIALALLRMEIERIGGILIGESGDLTERWWPEGLRVVLFRCTKKT